jgi:hypothetical protein
MADTQRTLAAILTLLADNTSGAISPQDLRDAVVSLRSGHGLLSVAAAAAAVVTIPDTTNYVEITNPVWTLGSNNYLFDESNGNGQMTYLGTESVEVDINATLSFTAPANNQVLHFRIGKNGSTIAASEVQQKVGTGSDVETVPITATVQLTTGDHLSLFVRNETAIQDITVQTATMHVKSELN